MKQIDTIIAYLFLSKII